MQKTLIDNQPIPIIEFTRCFVNHKSAYYQQWATGKDYGYRAVYQPITPKLICSHLAGWITISVPALDEQNSGRWICFDSDTENGALDKLAVFLSNYGWHFLRESRRPGRDGHLWLLFDSPIAGEHLVNLASAMLRLASVNYSGIEIFPKQAKADKLANGDRLPLGIHRKPEASNYRGWFDMPPKDIVAQLSWLTEQPLNSAAAAIESAKKYPAKEPYSVLQKQANKSLMIAANKITFENAIKLTAAKRGTRGWWQGHCPTSGHRNGDRNPSLSIKEADDGSAIVKCWTGCVPRDIYAYLGSMAASSAEYLDTQSI